jgi:hypothetical protein
MSTKELIRWGGLAGILSGVLAILTEVVLWAGFRQHSAVEAARSSVWITMVMLSFLGGYLSIIALIGLYARQVAESGRLGLVGFVLALLGMCFIIGFVWTGAFVVPALAKVAPESLDAIAAAPTGTFAAGTLAAFASFALGLALFGIALVRAGIVPVAAAWLLVVGAILNLLLNLASLPFTGVVYALALIWLGWWLWTEKKTPSIILR